MSILSLFASLAIIFAKFGAGAASILNTYQPVLPEELRTEE